VIVRHTMASVWGNGEVVKVTKETVTVAFENGGRREMDRRIAPLEIVAPSKRKARPADVRSCASNRQTSASYFRRPDRLFSLKELQKRGLPPKCPGVYGWYFKDPPDCVPLKGCTYKRLYLTKYWLLYVGKAKNLKQRIVDYHIEGKHYAEGTLSTLRLSLGCLLSRELGLVLYYPPQSFGKKGDKKSNKWLQKHARVAWMETGNIDMLETQSIRKFVLPLNLGDNTHVLKTPLSHLRSRFGNISKKCGHAPKKKDFRLAYIDFVKECRAVGIHRKP